MQENRILDFLEDLASAKVIDKGREFSLLLSDTGEKFLRIRIFTNFFSLISAMGLFSVFISGVLLFFNPTNWLIATLVSSGLIFAITSYLAFYFSKKSFLNKKILNSFILNLMQISGIEALAKVNKKRKHKHLEEDLSSLQEIVLKQNKVINELYNREFTEQKRSKEVV